MLNRRRQIAELLSSGSWLRSQTRRVLSGLVLVANAPQMTEAARKGERRPDGQERKNDDARNNADTSEENNQSRSKSDQRNDNDVSAESRDTGSKSENSGKRDRAENTNDNDENRDQRSTDNGRTRADSGRNADSDSRETSTEDGHSHHGGRHVLGFEQRASDTTADSPPTDVPVATDAIPANPNVSIHDIPSSQIPDLVVNGNDNVIAEVSTSGGFAFARSGDVIAVSGPDGASIVQTGDVSTGTNGTSPTEPSDSGGNNDVGFSS